MCDIAHVYPRRQDNSFSRQESATRGVEGAWNVGEEEHMQQTERRKEIRARGMWCGQVQTSCAVTKDTVEYVHSLGLAHNDISPSNILFDDDRSSRPILVDFDSAQPPGTELDMDDKYGTPGFCVEDMTVSAFENDSYSLRALEDFLQGGGTA
ncbi:hypothetical protein EXIGLDRAFT_757514 [Exidia glandulosa HHB12029]|uniref:Protein kinase domain-containing protein n=1 Tax=Exidia glandulosa HHB12029 TaxID=1314781 RepID=A0A166N1V6_EXIGL|nr:hypothetical protein EXIGLDRAFT_757514 [Exidia glandulosa HHB12029]